MPNNAHSSVLVNGARLKADRKAAGFTQASFAEASGSVSLVTVRRAEQGKRIIDSYLRRLAETLGQPAERYVIRDLLHESGDFVLSLAGEWSGFFVEATRGTLPYLVQEDIVLDQRGAVLEGEYRIFAPGAGRTERLHNGRVINNVLIGVLEPSGWRPPGGLAPFVQVATREGDWLEGFTAWYDGDTDQTECSRMVAVRRNCRDYLQYMREARRIMENEVRLYQLRNLVERGYDFAEATAMVQASASPRRRAPRRRDRYRAGGAGALRLEGVEFLARTGLRHEALLERLVDLDRATLGTGALDTVHEGTVAQWAAMFRAFPDYWRLVTRGDEIVGYWHFLPLTPERMEDARNGKLLVSTLTPADVLPPDRPGDVSLYMVMIASLPEYRFGTCFGRMFDALVDAVETLALQKIFIGDVVFAAWSPMAARLGARFGFERVAWLQDPDGATHDPPVPILRAAFADILKTAALDDYPSLRAAYERPPG